MKKHDVCGMGNCIVDTFVEISEEDFQELGIEKGTMHLVTEEEQAGLLSRFSEAGLVSGGSVVNSIIALSSLGGKGAFCGCIGDDPLGKHYKKEFDSLSIVFEGGVVPGGVTGSCVALVTPDAERTMRTCLGVANSFSEGQVDEQRIADSEWLFLEGYLFANPDGGGKELFTAVEYAKKHNTKIALTCSEAWVVESFSEPVQSVLAESSLVFCNETEACALAGKDDPREAFAHLAEKLENVVVTLGGDGVLVKYGQFNGHVEAFPCTPKDLTGAGDMFAGSFLYGVTSDHTPEQAARAANYMASKVICQVGARYEGDAKALWQEAL